MLSTYITQTRELLHDTNGTYWTDARLIRFINLARSKIAEEYGCIRKLIPGTKVAGSSAVPGAAYPGATTPNSTDTAFQTIANTERYAFSYANPYARQFSGVRAISDVISVSISWSGDSSQTGILRPSLAWMPFEDLQAYYRSYTLALNFPSIWSTQGDGQRGEVFLYPIPAQALEMEWDCFCVPKDIFTNDDYEALPATFTENVQFYAAHLAYLGMQRAGQADLMLQLFEKNCGIARGAADRGKTQRFYW
jgi:hypothetical protein